MSDLSNLNRLETHLDHKDGLDEVRDQQQAEGVPLLSGAGERGGADGETERAFRDSQPDALFLSVRDGDFLPAIDFGGQQDRTSVVGSSTDVSTLIGKEGYSKSDKKEDELSAYDDRYRFDEIASRNRRKRLDEVAWDSSDVSEHHSAARQFFLGRITLKMIGLFWLGFAGAVAHHCAYSFVDGKPTASYSQTWVTRIGNGCAYVVHTALVASVGIAYIQRVWRSVRRKALSVSSIDGLFSLLRDPKEFFKGEILLKAKLAVIVALLTWAIPIASIATPGTLTVVPSSYLVSNTIRATTFPDDGQGTLYDKQSWDESGDWGVVAPINALRKLTSLFFLTGSPILPDGLPCGQNCSFALDFYAPSLSCSRTLVIPDDVPIDEIAPALIPEYNETDFGDNPNYFCSAQYNESAGTTSLLTLWQPTVGLPVSGVWCDIYNASYHVDFDYASGMLSAAPTVDFLSPISFDFTNTALTNITPSAAAGQFPYNTTQFYSAFATVRSFLIFLEGYVTYNKDPQVLDQHEYLFLNGTQIELAKFTDDNGLPPYTSGPLGAKAFETMMINHTLSMLASSNSTRNVNATTSYTHNVFEYDAQALWEAYGSALAGAIVCLLVGSWSMLQNGEGAKDSFSEILCATRNPTLDAELRGLHRGTARMEKFKRLRLRYGLLAGTKEAAFGVSSDLERRH